MNCEGTTIKNKNYNTRRFPKGIKEIPYPAEDIIQRFISKDYVGEIRLNNETGLFEFNPALEDATASYACKEGNDFELLDVLYHNGTEFLKATASSPDTLGLWIVIEIVTENIFRIAQVGRHEVAEHGLEVGEYYFTGVSTTNPGKLVKDEPNLYSNPMVFVDDEDSISVLSFRPSLQPDGNGDHLPNAWNWTDLADTDPDYIGKSGYVPQVNPTETGLELVPIGDAGEYIPPNYITVSDYRGQGYEIDPPIAAFTPDVITGPVPLTVTFTNNTTGTDVNYVWDFGDNNTSTEVSPVHIYQTGGSKTVLLTATNIGGQDTATTIISPYVPIPLPVASFTASPDVGNAPLSVSFINTSSNGNTYMWDFGDGTTSTLENPSKVYNTPGVFTVTLTVNNETGSDTTTRDVDVTEFIEAPVASFTQSTTGGVGELDVTFTNTSTGGGTLTYFWEFGDGNTSTLESPTHTYSTYNEFIVRLTVTNTSGSSNVTSTVRVLDPSDAFIATYDIGSATSNVLTIPASGTNSFYIDWGDNSGLELVTTIEPSHTYATPGVYQVSISGSMSELSFFGQALNRESIIEVNQFGNVGWSDVRSMFRDCINLTTVDGAGTVIIPDSSNVSMQGMFMGSGLTSVNLTELLPNNVQRVDDLFRDCSNLTSVDATNCNTPYLESISSLCSGCFTLVSLETSGWIISQDEINLGNVLNACISLQTVDFTFVGNTKVTFLQNSFNNCRALTSITHLENFDTSNCKLISSCFRYTNNLDHSLVSGWNMSSCFDFDGVFRDVTLPVSTYDSIMNINTGWPRTSLTGPAFETNFNMGLGNYTNTPDVTNGRAKFENLGYIISDGGPV